MLGRDVEAVRPYEKLRNPLGHFYCRSCLLMPYRNALRAFEDGFAMRVFISVLMSGLAVAALLWCLAGFSRALRQPREVIGLWVRPSAPRPEDSKNRLQGEKFVVERLQVDDRVAHITIGLSSNPSNPRAATNQETAGKSSATSHRDPSRIPAGSRECGWTVSRLDSRTARRKSADCVRGRD